MKDLYTFDATPQEAKETYTKARMAYNNFFDELQIPYLAVKADSGSIGGDLSHEYHLPSPNGEDTIISCRSCPFAVNEELARPSGPKKLDRSTDDCAILPVPWFGVSKDRLHLVEAILPQHTALREPLREGHSPRLEPAKIDPYLMKTLYPDLDLSIERPLYAFVEHWTRYQSSPGSRAATGPPLSSPHHTCIYDYRVPQSLIDNHSAIAKGYRSTRSLSKITHLNKSISRESIDLARFRDGDQCPSCGEPSLETQKAIELGHTFYLGDRYSKPLDATFPLPQHADDDGGSSKAVASQDQTNTLKAPFQMGCHGIGISRMIAAVADSLSDEQGLVWPRVMAPYEAVILATDEHIGAAEEVWDLLSSPQEGSVEAVLDDRARGLGWKMKDADLIGFPVVIILGTHFRKQGLCEVVVRRLGTRQKVQIKKVKEYIVSRLDRI